jgi:hypothetical protein
VTDLMSEQRTRSNTPEDIRAAKEAMAGPVPLIADSPDTTFKLPRGLFYQGQWHKDVVIRELTGVDEETLAKFNQDAMSFFSTVIALGVESIGELDLSSLPMAERKGYLGQLLLGERDMLFVQVARAAFGDKKEITYACTLCEIEQTMDLVMSEDFKVTEVMDVETLTHSFTTSKGDVLEYRPATGADQEEALSKKGQSLAEQNTVMLSLCITKRNGDLIVDPLHYARNLSMKDRSALLQALVERQPTVNLVLQTQCISCGGDQTIGLGWGDIFRT